MVVSACLFTDASPVSSPAPSLQDLCSRSKSERCVGLSVLLQVGYNQGMEGNGVQLPLLPMTPFVLKPCSVTLHILLLPEREQKLMH